MRNFQIILLSSLSILLASCGHQAAHTEEAKVFTATLPVKKDTLIYHEYVSQIRAIQHIELRALEKGYLQKIFVDEGKFVKKGQLLFQILPIVYEAEAEKAKAEKQFAQIEYLNTKALADSNIVSKNELALAKAKLAKASADLNLAQAHLKFTELRAPFDGIVGRFNEVRVGSLLDEGELLTTLSDNSKMWVYFNVPESEYIHYKTHQGNNEHLKVKLQLADNEMFEEMGQIETIEADFNNETGNIAFRATFNNPKGILRHGETGNIFMPVLVHDGVLIPQKASYEILDKKFVFVVGEGGIISAREISIGQEIPHIYSVLTGLSPTDTILVEGLRKVKSGDEVAVKLKSFNQIISELKQLKAE